MARKGEYMKFTMFVPTKALFGAGKLNELHKEKLPGTTALVVTSAGKSVKENGYLGRVLKQLELAGVEASVFDQIQANPWRATVMDGAAQARQCGAEFLIALGGGSVMDASKGIALMATNSGDLWDYFRTGTGLGCVPEHRALPIVAIPTTSGTGSETDAVAIITNEQTDEKAGISYPMSFPVLAVIDPELTATVPPVYTAFQGFDALFHSTECFISKLANPMSDMYALTSMENIGRYLPRAVADGADQEAREHMMFASYLSGAVMTISCCTSAHPLEHALSAYHHKLPHGAGLIMIAKAYYTHFARTHSCDERMIRMAKALGKENATQAMDFVTCLTELMDACGVGELKMSDYGISLDEFEKMVANARATMGGLFHNDPVALTDEDCLAIYQASYR